VDLRNAETVAPYTKIPKITEKKKATEEYKSHMTELAGIAGNSFINPIDAGIKAVASVISCFVTSKATSTDFAFGVDNSQSVQGHMEILPRSIRAIYKSLWRTSRLPSKTALPIIKLDRALAKENAMSFGVDLPSFSRGTSSLEDSRLALFSKTDSMTPIINCIAGSEIFTPCSSDIFVKIWRKTVGNKPVISL